MSINFVGAAGTLVAWSEHTDQHLPHVEFGLHDVGEVCCLDRSW